MKEHVTPRERHTQQRKKRKNRYSLSLILSLPLKRNVEQHGCNSRSHHSNNNGTILVFFSAKEIERTMKKKRNRTQARRKRKKKKKKKALLILLQPLLPPLNGKSAKARERICRRTMNVNDY